MNKNMRWVWSLVVVSGLAAAPAWAARGAGVDADADGVPDSEDWCLNSAAGARVGADGCAAAEVGSWNTQGCGSASGSFAAGADRDADGIADSEDWCLNTASGTRVGPDGCALGEVGNRGVCIAGGRPMPAQAPAKPRAVVPAARDADRDGVEDADDNCPGTAPGVAVDDEGCAIIEKVVLKGVNFATGSATLKTSAHDVLRSVAATMKGDEDIEIEVQGHTDAQGTDENNLRLSQRRADAVKAFLVKEGIAAARITAKGYGEGTPVDSNDTAAGRANNRRVEFRVTAD